MSAIAEKPADGLGVIEQGKVYPLSTFKRLSGLGDWGVRMARRNGLQVRTAGRRSYVLGADWISYLAKDA